MKKSKFSQSLRRIQIDRSIAKLSEIPLNLPKNGWIKTVRELLGMTQKQLAERMSISPPSVHSLEKAEISGSTTLKSLDRAASALHCRLVYLLVPEGGSFDELLDRQAREVARRAVEMTSTSMHLEGQGIDSEMQNSLIQELAEELIRTSDKRIWETSI